MFVGVVVVMAVAAARGLAVLCKRAGDKGLDASVTAALGTCVYRDAGLGKRVDSATADAAADERVHAAVGEQARKGTVAGAAGAYDLLVEHLAVLDVIDLELLAAAKVQKMLPLSYVVATLMVPTSFAGHAAVVVVMGEYAILPPSMTIDRPLTSAFATLRCARLQIAATVARAMPMHWATSS